MQERIFHCLVCGKQGVDKFNNQQVFCCPECKRIGYRVRRFYIKQEAPRESCLFNKGVLCEAGNCTECGWNPKVELLRKEELAKCRNLQGCPA